MATGTLDQPAAVAPAPTQRYDWGKHCGPLQVNHMYAFYLRPLLQDDEGYAHNALPDRASLIYAQAQNGDYRSAQLECAGTVLLNEVTGAVGVGVTAMGRDSVRVTPPSNDVVRSVVAEFERRKAVGVADLERRLEEVSRDLQDPFADPDRRKLAPRRKQRLEQRLAEIQQSIYDWRDLKDMFDAVYLQHLRESVDPAHRRSAMASQEIQRLEAQKAERWGAPT